MDRSMRAAAGPLALYTAEQVQEFDRKAIADGTPGFELMHRAGAAAFACLQQRWPQHSPIDIFCGGGNNGGDGYIVAALAAQSGMAVRCWAFSETSRGDANIARELACDAGVNVQLWDGQSPASGAVVVDALLGTGFSGPLRGQYRHAIEAINAAGCPVLAIDAPSGLNCDTGTHEGLAIKASLTLSFIAWKQGLFTGLASQHCGALRLDGLGIETRIFEHTEPSAWRTDVDAELRQWGARPVAAHKGMYGHVLVAGGDYGTAGAVVLAASAAARCGAGLVSCVTRPEHVAPLLSQRPEVMAYPGADSQAWAEALGRASVLAVGPGLGQQVWGKALLDDCLQAQAPLLLDADALNILAADATRFDEQCAQQPDRIRVMTPHPGEAARLLKCSVAEVQADRFSSCKALAKRYRAVVLLKGAGTVISDGVTCWVNEGGNPGMASGGMGDVLSGMIAALLAQHLDAVTACRLAAALHCRAADRAAQHGERGLLAMDLVAQLRGVMNGH